MKLSLRLVCPKCEEKFPIWLGSPNLVRNGFLSAPWIKCSHCGTLSRQTANWPHALWAWPLTFFAIASVIGLAHNTERLGLLHRQHPLAYGGLGGLSIGLCFYLRRFGLKLTPVFGESGIKSDWDIRPWIKVFIVVCFVAAVALITHRWLATLASFAICLAVTGLFYVFSRKNNGNNVEATSPGDSLKAPPEK